MESVENDHNIGAVIITGKGEKAFVAGADIHEMSSLDADGVKKLSQTSRNLFHKMQSLSKPIIAAINGLALGGGSELALACDLRVSSETAKFALPEINLAIIPGGGGTQRLQRIIGQSRAMELMFFGEMITAHEAYNYGLVNKVVPNDQLLDFTMDWAQKLSVKPALAMKMLKKSIILGADVDLENALDIESACFQTVFASEDRKEGMSAFAEKRKPTFVGR